MDRLGGGHRNLVVLAERSGRRFVARRSTRSEAALTWELNLLDTLADAGFWVPAPVRSADGRGAVEGIVVAPFLAGRSPVDPGDWARLAGTLACLHEATRDWAQRPGFSSSADLLAANRGGDIALDVMPAEAVEQLRAAWRSVQVGSPCVVHGDPGAGNVMISDDGVVGLLDWDEARVDLPWFDLAAIPEEVSLDLPLPRLAVVRAGVAWEAATCWQAEPTYARRRLRQLRAMG